MRKVFIIAVFLFFFAETHREPVVTCGSQTITSSSTSATATVTTTGSATYGVEWTKFPSESLHLKVGIIGSSTAEGNSGLSNHDSSYVQRLYHYYKGTHFIIDTVYNLALGGTDPRYGLPTNGPPSRVGFPTQYDTARNVNALTNRGCNVIIWDYPTNDYLTTQMTIANMALYAQITYDTAVAHGAVCFMWGTGPRPGYDAASKAMLIVRNDTLRNRFGEHFLDRYDLLADPNNPLTYKREYAAPDSIHTTDAGQRQIWNYLRSRNIFQSFVSNSATIASPTSTTTSISNIPLGTTWWHVGAIDSWGFGGDTVFSITRSEDEGGGGFTPTTGLLKFYGRLKIKQ